jgi:hypothetical protein
VRKAEDAEKVKFEKRVKEIKQMQIQSLNQAETSKKSKLE